MKFVLTLLTLVGSLVTTTAGDRIEICGQDLSQSKKHPCAKTDCTPFGTDIGWSCYRCNIDVTKKMWLMSKQREIENAENDIPHLEKNVEDINAKILKIGKGTKPEQLKALQKLWYKKEKTLKLIEKKAAQRSAYTRKPGSENISPEDAAKKLVEVKKALKVAQKKYRAKKEALNPMSLTDLFSSTSPKPAEADAAELKTLKAEKDRLKAEKLDLTALVFATCHAGFHKGAERYLLMDAKTKNLAYFSTKDLPTALAKSALVRRGAGEVAAVIGGIIGAILLFPFKLADDIIGIPFAILGAVVAIVIVALVIVAVGIFALFAVPIYGISKLVGL
jgi:hypothetical protein